MFVLLNGRNTLRSGLYFSNTETMCYSRQVEESLRYRMAKGMVVRKEQGTLVVVYSALGAAPKKFDGAMDQRNR